MQPIGKPTFMVKVRSIL